jgi:pimeloyl-ACP methyl ester carboxylesterase
MRDEAAHGGILAAEEDGRMPDVATYVNVAGRRVWHEVSGAGRPLVLLHGGFSGAASFAAQTPALAAAGFRVHVPERRGHAHTPDVDGPLTYAVMAEDTIAYLAQEVRGPAHLVGWSDGAVVALLVAMRRPDLVARMVLIDQYYAAAGRAEDGDGDLTEALAAPEAMEFLRHGYDPVSPDGPEHFAVVHAKTIQMWRTEPEIPLSELAGVTAPTLVLQADRGAVRLDHSAAVAAALPEGRLAVLPGTHSLPAESPGPVNALLVDFLGAATP